MKLKLITLAFLSGSLLVRGQGTFVWDQQATGLVDNSAFLNFDQPLGQSFTPSFSSISAAAFYFSGASASLNIEVNVRSDSITGTILGTSAPTTVSPSDDGPIDFLFSNPITLTPGVTYFLQPVVTTGDTVFANEVHATVPNGGAIAGGVPQTGWDFWFQEGIVAAPEPSPAALFAVAGGILYCYRRQRRISRL